MKIPKILVFLSFGLLLGCETEGPVTSPHEQETTSSPDQEPLFVKDMNMRIETQIEPQRLEAILDALVREGRKGDADRVSGTYDLASGRLQEKFLPQAEAQSPGGLAKSSAWSPSYLRYQSYQNGAWQPLVGPGVSSGGTAQNGLVKISYTNGAGAPLLSFQVSNYYNQWSTARSWNGVAGWPDATGYPIYGLFKIRITTANALGQGYIVSTYRVLASQSGWGAWFSQGQAAGPTPSGSGLNYMQAFQYYINYI